MKIGQLVSYRDRLRKQGKVVSRVNRRREFKIRVMSNVAKPWFGKQPMTPSLWRNV